MFICGIYGLILNLSLKKYGYRISVKRRVSSTNSILKGFAQNGAEHLTVLIAKEQTSGRGRMDRQFYSPSNTGLYMSILLRKEETCNKPLLITTDAAVATAKALEKMTGEKASIKWVNDIYMNERKVCGILAESNLHEDNTGYVILGIGINITSPKNGFPADIRERAGAVFKKRYPFLRERTAIVLLKELAEIFSKGKRKECFDEYKNRSMIIGKEITILKPGEIQEKATVLSLNEDYSLKVKKETGETENLFSGDVSIKI